MTIKWPLHGGQMLPCKNAWQPSKELKNVFNLTNNICGKAIKTTLFFFPKLYEIFVRLRQKCLPLPFRWNILLDNFVDKTIKKRKKIESFLKMKPRNVFIYWKVRITYTERERNRESWGEDRRKSGSLFRWTTVARLKPGARRFVQVSHMGDDFLYYLLAFHV